jgi:cell wall-associated NlpC family hydrolase
MPNTRQIKRSLNQLSEEAKRSANPSSQNFGKNLDVVTSSVDKISKIPENARTPGQKAALEALGIWAGNPATYASTADIPARYGMGRLDPKDANGADLKCNRFVAEAAAISGSPFPLSGINPFNRTPVSAENLYQQESIPYMSNVAAKDAKIGDVISFPGHVGIYLGNSTYVSARHSTDFFGNQVEDGVQIHKVSWDQQPKFRRLDGRQVSLNETVEPKTQGHIEVADRPVNQRHSYTTGNVNGNGLVASKSNNLELAGDTVPTTNPDTAINTTSLVTHQNVTESKAELSKVVAMLKGSATDVKKQYGLDVNTEEGLGKAVMQYWKENNLDPKTLKEQLPNIKDSEFATASKSLAKTNTTETTNTKQLATQQR